MGNTSFSPTASTSSTPESWGKVQSLRPDFQENDHGQLSSEFYDTAKSHRSCWKDLNHAKQRQPLGDLTASRASDRALFDATNSQSPACYLPINSVLASGSDEAIESLHIPHGLPLETIEERRSRSTLETRQSSVLYARPLRRAKSDPEGLDAAPSHQPNLDSDHERQCGRQRRLPAQPKPPAIRSAQVPGIAPKASQRRFQTAGDIEPQMSPTSRIRQLLRSIKVTHVQGNSALKSSEWKSGIPSVNQGRQSASSSISNDKPHSRNSLSQDERPTRQDSPASLHDVFYPRHSLDLKRCIFDRHTVLDSKKSKKPRRGHTSRPFHPAELIPAPLTIRNKDSKPLGTSNSGSPVARFITSPAQIQGPGSTHDASLGVSSPCSNGDNTDEASRAESGNSIHNNSFTTSHSFDAAADASAKRSTDASNSLESLVAGQSLYQAATVFHDAVSNQQSKSRFGSCDRCSDDDPFFDSPLPEKLHTPSPGASDVPSPLRVRQKKLPPPNLRLFPAACRYEEDPHGRRKRNAPSLLHTLGSSRSLDEPKYQAEGLLSRQVARTCPHGKPVLQPNDLMATKLNNYSSRRLGWLNFRSANACWRCDILDIKRDILNKPAIHSKASRATFPLSSTKRRPYQQHGRPLVTPRSGSWIALPDSSGRHPIATDNGIAYARIYDDQQLEDMCEHQRVKIARNSLRGQGRKLRRDCWGCHGRSWIERIGRWILRICSCGDAGKDEGEDGQDAVEARINGDMFTRAGRGLGGKIDGKRWRWSSGAASDGDSTPERTRAKRPTLSEARVRSMID